MSRTTDTKAVTTPMATTTGSRKLLGADSGCGVVVGSGLVGVGEVGGGVLGGGVLGGGVLGGAMAKPEPATFTNVPGCPSWGSSVTSGLPAASRTVTAGS
jgi:hypothetical protein